MRTEADRLMLALTAWRPGQSLRPLIRRVALLCGPSTTRHLPRDPATACHRLMDIVLNYVDRCDGNLHPPDWHVPEGRPEAGDRRR